MFFYTSSVLFETEGGRERMNRTLDFVQPNYHSWFLGYGRGKNGRFVLVSSFIYGMERGVKLFLLFGYSRFVTKSVIK